MKSSLGFIFCFLWVFVFADNNQNSFVRNDLKLDLLKSADVEISITGSILSSDILQNYTISGTVKHAITLEPFVGVTITFSEMGTIITDNQGNYSMIVPSGWTGSASAYYCGYYVFNPSEIYFSNVKKDYTGQNFTGSSAQVLTINGTITNTESSSPLTNYVIDFGNGISATTDAQGHYSLVILPCYSYTLTPFSDDYSFSPVSRTYTNITASVYNQDYGATPKVFGLPPGWEYVNTGLVHIISIKTTANPNFCGIPLLSGDWIGVFFLGTDGLLHCAGAGMWTGTENTAVIAQGDDSYTPEKDGFAAFETMNWKVYSSTNTHKEYVAYPVYQSGAGFSSNNKWGPSNLSIINSLPAYFTHSITIPQGWSGISSYILPRTGTSAIATLMAPILSKLIILQNLTKMYYPSQSINTIGSWSSLSGYKIKVTEPVTLPIIGCDYTPKTLDLVAGWNLIPILSNCNAPVETIFASNMNKITVIKEIAGPNIYWPAMNIKTLLTLQPGKAYLIYITQVFTVTFPACTDFKDVEIVNPILINNSPWITPVMTPSNHSIALPVAVFDKLMAGDIIGAFTDDGICAGLVSVDDLSTSVLLQVFGDDPTTFEKDGYEDNEILNFKLYRPQLEQEIMIGFDFDASLHSSDGRFATDGLSAASKIVFNPTFIGEHGNNSISFYPNPSNGLVDFVAGDNQKSFDVTILDLTGQKVYQTTFSAKARINLSEAPKGIYIVKIESGNFIKVEKLVVQ